MALEVRNARWLAVLVSLALCACGGGSGGSGGGDEASAVPIDARAEQSADLSDPDKALAVVATFPMLLVALFETGDVFPTTTGSASQAAGAGAGQASAVISRQTVDCRYGGRAELAVTNRTAGSPFRSYLGGESLRLVEADFDECVENRYLRLQGPAEAACGEQDRCNTVTYFRAGADGGAMHARMTGYADLEMNMAGGIHWLRTSDGGLADRRMHLALRLRGTYDPDQPDERGPFSGFLGRPGQRYRMESLDLAYEMNGPIGFYGEDWEGCMQGTATVQTLSPLGNFTGSLMPRRGTLRLANDDGETAEVQFGVPSSGRITVVIDGERTEFAQSALDAMASRCPL